MATLNNCTAPPSFSNPKSAAFQANFRRSGKAHLQLVSSNARIFSRSMVSLPVRRRSSYFCSSAVDTNAENGTAPAAQSEAPVRIIAIVGEGSVSPLKSTPWYDVMLHTAKKLKWVDEGFEMLVFTDNVYRVNDDSIGQLHESLRHAEILMIVAVTNQESVKWIQTNCQNVPNVICFDSSPTLTNKLGGSLIQTKTVGSIFSKLPLPQLKKQKESEEVVRSVYEAWDRHNSDDIKFCLLVIINSYIRPVPILKNLRAKGLSTLNCMVKNCGPQILNCLLDPNCRKALQCLNNCSPIDQVCNYRCIASYESRQLEEFSLCVLQKNNCLELDAKIPDKPVVTPMVQFRGNDLDHETAEDLFVGWLGSLDWSWRVVAGQNPAYDQFPCQYQLFYRGKAKGSFWYEPVFQVQTLDGDLVWRRRKYRVKRGKIPAARVAGQSYTGAVLVSPDGSYPDETETLRLVSALDRCSIKQWELFDVDNCSCKNPPLGLPEGSSLHYKIKVQDMEDSSVGV